MLTDAGECLRRIIQPIEIPDYESIEKDFMLQNGVTYKEPSEYRIYPDETGSLKLARFPIAETNE